MQVTLDFNSNICHVTRGDSPKEYNESTLLYHVKQELRKQGFDVIKKRMWKDGHLADDRQQYIRTRKPPLEDDPNRWRFQIYDGMWGIRYTYEPYNEFGEVKLILSW